ncbi:unnamed protein product, partial [Mesorhabditis spiculigera]
MRPFLCPEICEPHAICRQRHCPRNSSNAKPIASAIGNHQLAPAKLRLFNGEPQLGLDQDFDQNQRQKRRISQKRMRPELAASCANYAKARQVPDGYGIFRMPDGQLTNNTVRRGALFCRSGSWLEILDERESSRRKRDTTQDNLIWGNLQTRSEFSILHFISVAIGLVSIRGEKSNRFLCMDNSSRLYAAPADHYSAECVFLEEMLENYYNLYSSCAHYPSTIDAKFKPWYVAIRKDGHPRKGRNSRKRRRSAHFLVVHFDIAQNVPDDIDVTQVVSSSIRRSTGDNAIDESKWQGADYPMVPTAPTIIATPKPDDGKQKKKKKNKRREERLKKEREEREKRQRLIEQQRQEKWKKSVNDVDNRKSSGWPRGERWVTDPPPIHTGSRTTGIIPTTLNFIPTPLPEDPITRIYLATNLRIVIN